MGIDLFPPIASSYAGDIDGLFWLVTYLMGFSLFVTWIAMFYLMFRFKKKEGVKAKYILATGNLKWVILPLLLFVAFDGFVDLNTASVWASIKQKFPAAQDNVRVVARQWDWTFIHSGPDGKLDTADDIESDGELHLKKDTVVYFDLQSQDVIHSFSIPVFRLKQDVIPGRAITSWAKPIMTGSWDLQCTEMCGVNHALMAAKVIVHEEADYNQWVSEQ